MGFESVVQDVKEQRRFVELLYSEVIRWVWIVDEARSISSPVRRP